MPRVSSSLLAALAAAAIAGPMEAQAAGAPPPGHAAALSGSVAVERGPYSAKMIFLPGAGGTVELTWAEADRFGGALKSTAEKAKGAGGEWVRTGDTMDVGGRRRVVAWLRGGKNPSLALDVEEAGRPAIRFLTEQPAQAEGIGSLLSPGGDREKAFAKQRRLRGVVRDLVGADLTEEGKIVMPEEGSDIPPMVRVRRWLWAADVVMVLLSLTFGGLGGKIGNFLGGMRLVFLLSMGGLLVWQLATLLPILFS